METEIAHHYIVNCYGSPYNADMKYVRYILRKSVKVAKARLLKSHWHIFLGGAFSGIILISESHFAVHTWVEYDYMAFDFFSCGDKEALQKSVDYVIKHLKPNNYTQSVLGRGIKSSAIEVKNEG